MFTPPNPERKHIVFMGRNGVGKTSLINEFFGRDIYFGRRNGEKIEYPVLTPMELLPYGPVVLVDTEGIDAIDESSGSRMKQMIKSVSHADFAIVVLDARYRLSKEEKELFSALRRLNIPFLAAVNKIEYGINMDLVDEIKSNKAVHFEISIKENAGVEMLKSRVTRLLPKTVDPPLINDLVNHGDTVMLIVPDDITAPRGRLIMSQVQTIREALDEDTIIIITKQKEFKNALGNLKNPPELVVTDSQSLISAASALPRSIKLTTFSILMGRYKGDLSAFMKGLKRLGELKDGDKVLVCEACGFHKFSDTGRVKIPKWIQLHTKKNLQFEIKSGEEFPANLTDYKLIVHCGGCMLNRRNMQMRIKEAKLLDVPIVNYGILISYLHGIMQRAIMPFPEAAKEWDQKVFVK